MVEKRKNQLRKEENNMKKWIKGAIKHKGGLHRALGVPMKEKIPAGKIAEAMKSSSTHVKKMANLAKTLSKLRKGK